MLSIGLISLLVAIPVFSYRITPSLFNRITSVVLIYSALLAFNGLHIESLASGVGIYSGLFIATTVYCCFIVPVLTQLNIDKCKSFIRSVIILVATSIYYHVITIAMSRYTLFFFVILLTIVMSIYISTPVYCQNESTQAIATTTVESKASISAIAKYVDTTGSKNNLLDKDLMLSKYQADAASNHNIVNNTDSVNRPDMIPCILEEGETSSFVQSSNNFVVNWLNFNYGTRVPANLSGNLQDYFTFDFSFTSLNLSIIFMHTLVYWFLFFIFTQLSLNYFSSKLTSWLNKEKMNAAVMRVFISINMLVVSLLFIVILIFSVYIYFYCNIPKDVAYHINNTMKILLDETTDITISNTFLGADSSNYMKLSGSVALCILGIFRTYVVIRPLNLSTTITSCFVLFVFYTVNITYNFITKITTMSTDSKPTTLLELFARYNDCNHVLFYSMIMFIISVVIVTILSHYKNSILATDNYQCNVENNKIVNSNKFISYELLIAYINIIASMSIYCAFQSIVFLNVYSIPGYIDHYLTLY